MRVRFELEYAMNCSPKVLFTRLSTPEGLQEWFAEKVDAIGDLFTFSWDKAELQAKLAAIKENKLVRFEWSGIENDEANYFEFRINIEELTGELALIISDFAEENEKQDAISLWDSQITDLKRLLGT